MSENDIQDTKVYENSTANVSTDTEPSLPCIVDGNVTIQLERLASVRDTTSESSVGGAVDVITSSSASQTFQAPNGDEEAVATAAFLVPQQRKGSVDQAEESSQESCSPLHSPRDVATEDKLSPFYTFLHSKVCIFLPVNSYIVQNFPAMMNFTQEVKLKLVIKKH